MPGKHEKSDERGQPHPEVVKLDSYVKQIVDRRVEENREDIFGHWYNSKGVATVTQAVVRYTHGNYNMEAGDE